MSPQKLRITNQSAYTISDLKVRFPDELIAFGDVPSGETTEYQTAVKGVYRYSGYQIKLDGKDYEQVPYDFMGERPLQGYSFTYILNVDPVRKTDPVQKTGIQVIQLVEVRLDQLTASALTPQPTLYFAWPPAASTPAARLANPRTYSDPGAGYAIDFPAGWFQSKGPGESIVLTSFPWARGSQARPQPGQARVDVQPQSPQACTTQEQLVDIARSQEGQMLWSQRWRFGARIDALRMQWSSDNLGESALLLAVIERRCLMITGTGDLRQFDALAVSLRSTHPPQPTTTPLNIPTTAFVSTRTATPIANPVIPSKPAQGFVYVILIPQKPPFLLALARVPAACFLEPQACPSSMSILYRDTNPNQPVLRQTDLIFSPDGKSIWWNNDYQGNIFALDTGSLAIRPVAQDSHATQGDFQWSPDGKWVAVAAQGKGPYDGQVLLVDTQSGTRQILLNTPNDMKVPVGWMSDHELLVMIYRYGPPALNPSGKWVVNRQWLALVDITTGQVSEYGKDVSAVPQGAISPRREWLALYQNRNGNLALILQSLKADKSVDLKTQRDFLGWSPDGQWIAIRGEKGEISILHPDGSGERSIATLSRVVSVRWFLDNQHLLVTWRTTGKDGLDQAAVELISIEDGSIHPVDLKGFYPKELVPDSFYWAQPVER